MTNFSIKNIGWVIIFGLFLTGMAYVITGVVTLNNLTTIRSTWNKFEIGRSEKVRVVNALRQELGYGGMIHSFKNYVLRHDKLLLRRTDANLGGARAMVTRYRTFSANEDENDALTAIEHVLDNYEKALETAEILVSQNKTPSQIDGVIKVDDAPALNGLDILDEQIVNSLGRPLGVRSKPEIISALRKAYGYGGMIHNFKNFLLRHDDDLIDVIKRDLNNIESEINQYTSLGISDLEEKALNDIRKVLGAYAGSLAMIDRLAEGGVGPSKIDQVVRIDDAPALKGFTILTKEIVSDSRNDANKLTISLNSIFDLTILTNVTVVFLIIFLIIVSYWLIRMQIVAPITKITDIMTQLASGNLEISIEKTGGKNEIGEMVLAVKVFRNTAVARIHSDEARNKQEKRSLLILDNAYDGIISIDSKGIVESFNPAAERIFGYTSNEIIEQNVKKLMPSPFHDEHDGYLKNYLTTGNAKVIGLGRELIGLHKDGTEFPLELAVSEMEVEGKRMFTGIVRDITDRKQAEKMKSEFVSTVSHELRTPLTSIKGSLGLIRSGAIGELPDKLKSMLDIAYSNSDRLVHLINDILDVEKIEAGKMDFNIERLDLGFLLEQALEANKGYGEEHGVNFVLSSDLPKAQVEGDPNRLMQVLANLMSNAAKFSSDGSEVVVSLEQREEGFRVSVTDHGSGIPEEFKDKIFGKFHQADSSDTRSKGGTGLGLNITRAIIEQHGGTIGFETELGKGSTFFFDLPILPERRIDQQPDSDERHQYHVLICEDDPDTAALLDMMLKQDGFVTDIVRSAADAEALLGTKTYDAMTLDLKLPDKDGITLLKELRADPKTRDLPIIVVSAKAAQGAKELNGDAFGVIDWLEKPIDQKRLSEGLRRAIASSSNGKARILHVEDDEDILKIVASVVGDLAEITSAMTVSEAKALLQQHSFDLVILDLLLPDGQGEELLPLLKKGDHKSTPVIVFSVNENTVQKVDSIKAVLVKSKTTNEALLETIHDAILSWKSIKE